MAITFNKKSWKSRISEHPTRRRLTIVDQSLSYSLVDVARDEGTIEQVGDTFDKSTMDDMENRIENIAITAQAECDGLQEQIDNLPSLVDVKEKDIGWKEIGTPNTSSGSIRVNPWELFSGTVDEIKSKNLFNKDDSSLILTGYVTSEGRFADGGTGVKTICLPVEPSTTYTVSKIQSARFRIGIFSSIPNYNDTTTNYIFNDTATSLTVTTGISEHYLLAFVYNSNSDTLTLEQILDTVQIEVGSSATSYQPYFEPYIAITGFIPSAKFFQMGRRYLTEEPVMNFDAYKGQEELNEYYQGVYLADHFANQYFFTGYESVDNIRVNSVTASYAVEHTSVEGEIYTASGKIACDLVVTDIWGWGGNGQTSNRFTTTANGFPIELKPVNQSLVTGLTVGSPVQFRITGELNIGLRNVGMIERPETPNDSQFYPEYQTWADTRDGMHYQTHYIEIEKGTSFNLSTITTARNYHFYQASVREGQTPDPRDYLEWTNTDSEITITAKASATGYASDMVLIITHSRDGDTEHQYDTREDIVISTVAST